MLKKAQVDITIECIGKALKNILQIRSVSGETLANGSMHLFQKERKNQSYNKYKRPHFEQRRFNNIFQKKFSNQWHAKAGLQRFENRFFSRRNFGYRCYTCSKCGHTAKNCN